jgi:hypothetical protein
VALRAHRRDTEALNRSRLDSYSHALPPTSEPAPSGAARLETFICMRRTNANTLDSRAINTSGANSDAQELRFESTARRVFVVAKCVLRRAYQRHRAVPRGIHVVDPGAEQTILVSGRSRPSVKVDSSIASIPPKVTSATRGIRNYSPWIRSCVSCVKASRNRCVEYGLFRSRLMGT